MAEIIAGYEILGELGHGGMGIVYKARQTSLKRIVALKRIRAGTDAGPQDLARFRAEAESVARLQHPNIVQIYEVGEHEGLPFFSLEYVEGGSLDRRLAGTAQPAAVAARLVQAIALGVHDAHEHGLVHRDLKPANVLLAGGPDVPLEQCIPKVSDFGLVKRLDDNSAQTQSGAVIGTPAYMAPEQAGGRNRDVGPHTDVWALGAILYECLTGRPPFQGASPLDTLAQILSEEPVPPRKLNRKVPRDLETICLKCLHKVPARRYGSARELADDLHRFLTFEPIRARRVSVAERGWRWVRRRPAASLAALLLVLLLAGAGVGYRLWRQAQQAASSESGLVVEYYDTVLRPDEEPRGVGRLSEAEALRRPRAFKLYRRGNHIEQVDVLGPQGRLLRHNPFHLLASGGAPGTVPLREASYHFVHDEDGRVSEVTAHDGANRVLWSVQRLASNRVRYTERSGPWGESPAAPALLEVIRDDTGELREVWHIDEAGRRTPARRKAHGLRRETGAGLRKPPEGGAGGEVRLTLLDGKGKPVGEIPCWVIRPWDAAGRAEETYFDAAGKPIAGPEGCPRWVWLLEGPHALRGAGLDVAGRPMRARDGSYSSRRRFDEQGREVEQAWFGLDGAPLVTPAENAKVTTRYDSRGELQEKSYWVLDERRNYVLRRRADAADRALEKAYFTPAGRPTLNEEGVHRWTTRYDEHGNRVEGAAFGPDGKPYLFKDAFHRWTARYDERGNCIEETYFGVDGKLAARTDEGNLKRYARKTWEYDSAGKLHQHRYYVPDGKGRFVLCRRTDAANRTLEEVFFTPQGQPTLHKEGYHRWTARYDERGNRLEEAYFGPDGRPAARVDEGALKGCARLTWEYDGKGKLHQSCYFVHDGKGGYALRRRADAAGRTLEEAFFTPAGQPTLSVEGVHRWTARYDERGNKIEGADFGLDGKPCLRKDGSHRWTNRYDQRGHLVESAYFGRNGKPCLHREGYHQATFRYDERGNRLEEAYFGPDGRPAARVDEGPFKGCARLTWEYDGKGKLHQSCYFVPDGKGGCVLRRRADAADRTLEEAYFTPAGQPTLNEGVHRWTARYDKHGHVVEGMYFGRDSKPCLHRNGYHRFLVRYDEHDNRVEDAYFGVDGRPAARLDAGIYKGCARLTWEYDARGNLRQSCYFVPNDKGGYGLRRRTDAADRTLEYAFFTIKGQPTLHKDGYHRWTARYDERGNRLEEAYFGLDGKPCLRKDGYHRRTARYDEHGHHLERTYFGLDGKPCLHKEGYHRVTARYDKRGQLIEAAYFGVDGKPRLHKDGYHRVTARHDEQGHRVEESYFGLAGRPAARLDKGIYKGCARLTWEYDAKGKLRQRCYFVPDGKGGYILYRRTDAAKRTLELAYFTMQGRPALHKDGHHRWTTRYDEHGNRVEWAYFGLDDKPCLSKDKYHRLSLRYDSRGKLVEGVYFGPDGKPCLHREGYHRATRSYDERGRFVSTAVFDLAGRRLQCRILVEKVSPGSLAARAGLREGDILLRYAGKELTSAAHFTILRSEEGTRGPPGKLELLREGKALTVELPPGTTGMTLLNKAGPADASR